MSFRRRLSIVGAALLITACAPAATPATPIAGLATTPTATATRVAGVATPPGMMTPETTAPGAMITPSAMMTPGAMMAAMPTLVPGTPAIVAGVTAPVDVPRIMSQMLVVQSYLEQVQSLLGQVRPADVAKLATLQSAMLGRMNALVVEIQMAVGQLSPEEQQAVGSMVAQMQRRLESIMAVLERTSVATTATPSTTSTIDDLADQMTAVQSVLVQRTRDLTPAQLQKAGEHMIGSAGDFSTLFVTLLTAFNRMDPMHLPMIMAIVSDLANLAGQFAQTVTATLQATPTP